MKTPLAATVPDTVLAQAGKTPDAVAVESAGSGLTYAELAARAHGLAEHLRRLGTGPGDRVAVAVPRGVELVPALLGVQLTGAAYVPLDPEHPSERADYILADAHAQILVTADATGSPDLHADVRVHLDDVAVRPAPDRAYGPRPDSAAYTVYTSGSTGRPKGVQVTHRNLTNLVRSVRDLGVLPDGAVLPAVTTVSFDIAALELFVPLVTGGTVVVVPQHDATDPHRLAAVLADTGARLLQATPVTWRLLLEAGWSPPPGFTVLCGGERLPAELRERLTRDGVVLWDLYGPTETTIWSTVTRYEPGTAPQFHPIAGTSLIVLDDRLEPAAEGELYVGGTGVADGYVGRPALTAERFVADAFTAAPGARLYRTGDVTRRHRDGIHEVVGRSDDQVKIRGFRVEPGEIENILDACPGVAEAAVRTVDAPGGTPALVAYVRPVDPADPPQERRLRAHLARSLPGYMVPRQLVVLDELPRTPNSKLDRAALPVPPTAPARNGTGSQERVAGVLARMLGREDVDPHDDFFALGGNSMLAIQAVHELNAELRSDLAVTALLEVRTAYGIAELVNGDSARVPQLPSRDAAGDGRLSAAQWQLWLHQHLEPNSTAYNEALAVQLSGPPDAAALQAALDGVLDRHDILRTRYEPGSSGQPAPVVEPAAGVRLELEDGDPASVLAAELARPFDLAAGPPVRARAVRTGTAECAALLVLHHIAADDRSRALIASQLRAGYRGRALPTPTLQYAQYAAWQRELATSPAVRRQLDFWRMALDGLDPAELRTDRPRTARRDRRAGTIRFAVAPEVSGALRDVAAAHDATAFMALLASLHCALGGYVTGTDVTVGTPAPGRDRPDLADAVGVFTNTVVTRVSLAGEPSYAQVLGQVRDSAVAAFEHATAPFQDVVAAAVESGTRLHPARNPLFDVMFSVQDTSEPAGFVLPDAPGARFDLSCRLTPRTDGGYDGRFEYATQILDEVTVVRLAGDFVELLEDIATRSPDHVTGHGRVMDRTVVRS